MTSVVSPAPSEYSFQCIADKQPDIVPLNEVKENIQAGEKVAVKGRIKKGSNVERVGARNLQMLKSTIFDGTSTLFLTLWENEIDSISEDRVYILSNVNVKVNDLVKRFQLHSKQYFLKLTMMIWRGSMIRWQSRCWKDQTKPWCLWKPSGR